MKHLILAAAVTCYNYGSVTNCTDGTVAYNYGTVTQVLPGNGDPQVTLYQYGNVIQTVAPIDFVPIPTDIPLPWYQYQE